MANDILINDLCFRYPIKHTEETLKNICLNVSRGQIYGFLGPNGAGKTTLIKILCGMIPKYQGSVHIADDPPFALAVKQKIGYMPETAQYYWYLTPFELFVMYGKIFRIPNKILRVKIDELLDLVGLTDVRNRLIKTFSKGMMQRVNFAQALINDPQILILDEPMSGLDPLSRIKTRDLLVQLKNRGKTIFFSSHELSEAELICDEVGIIKDGRMLAAGKLFDLLAQGQGSLSLEQYFIKIIT